MESARTAPLDRRVDAALEETSAVITAFGEIVLGWSVFVVVAIFWFESVAP